MALALDGFKVLRRVGKNPDVFMTISAEAGKAARTLLTKQLKAKTTDLRSVHDIRKALGDESFSLFIDGLTDSEVKTALGRLDKHHPELKTGNADWRRNRLRDLARGDAEPFIKPSRTGKSKTSPKGAAEGKPPGASGRLNSEAMAAVRRRS